MKERQFARTPLPARVIALKIFGVAHASGDLCIQSTGKDFLLLKHAKCLI